MQGDIYPPFSNRLPRPAYGPVSPQLLVLMQLLDPTFPGLLAQLGPELGILYSSEYCSKIRRSNCYITPFGWCNSTNKAAVVPGARMGCYSPSSPKAHIHSTICKKVQVKSEVKLGWRLGLTAHTLKQLALDSFVPIIASDSIYDSPSNEKNIPPSV